MTDRDQGIASRLSRVEERAARLEERINADREQRQAWDREMQRRLAELNNHSARQDERDAHYMSKEIYESRHSQLELELETRTREAEKTIREQAKQFDDEHKRLLQELDVRMQRHEQSDNENHRLHESQISELRSWRDNVSGRFWMLGTLLTIGVTLLSLALHYFFK